jgi:CPA2 family monovalent cation:H+ antiporter-2
VAHTPEEAQWLREAGVDVVLRSQQALAQALVRVVGERVAAVAQPAR